MGNSLTNKVCFVCVQLSIFLFASISYYLTYARGDKKTVGMWSLRGCGSADRVAGECTLKN